MRTSQVTIATAAAQAVVSLLVWLAGVSTAAAAAQGASWRAIGPPAGDVCLLVGAPRDDRRRYALIPGAPNGGTLYTTADGGGSWTLARIPGRGLAGGLWCALAVDPAAPRRVFAASYGYSDGGTRTTVYGSENGGRTWRALGSPPQAQSFVSAMSAVRVGGRLVLLLAEASQVLRSVDGGATWSVAGGLPGSFHTVHALTPDPFRRNVLYAAVEQSGVWVSRDAGLSFVRANTGIAAPWQTSLAGLVADPARRGRLWAFGTRGEVPALYRSEDGASTWQAAPGGFGNVWTITSLTVDADGQVFAVGAGSMPRLLRSTDGAQPFTILPDSLPRARRLFATAGGLGIYGSGGIFRSLDGGASWQRWMQGLNAGTVTTLAVADGEPPTLWAKVNGWAGLARSTDEGVTWDEVGAETLGRLGVQEIVTVPGEPAHLAVVVSRQMPNRPLGALEGALARSTDGGEHWEVGDFAACQVPHDVVIDPTNASRWLMLLATSLPNCSPSSCPLQRSLDGGRTFTCVDRLEAGWGFGRLRFAQDGVLYAAVGPGFVSSLWRSLDGGDTWEQRHPFPAYVAAVDPASSSTLWADLVEIAGVWQRPARSLDGGLTWEPVDLPVSTETGVAAIVFDPDRAGHLAIAAGGRLLWSTDGGETFAVLAPPAPLSAELVVRALAVVDGKIHLAGHGGILVVEPVATTAATTAVR